MVSYTRRDFLAAGSMLILSGSGFDQQERANRIAVSTWSFHNYFPHTRYGAPKFETTGWRVEDVVKKVKNHLGIDAFELSSAHLESFEQGYLNDLNAFMKEHGCKFIHLSDNVRGLNLAQADAGRREAAIKTFTELLDVAHRLDIPTMRVNTGRPTVKDWDLNITIDSYRRLAKLGTDRGVEIIVENHFGISADPKNVAAIIEAVGDNISSCPDFGLFENDEERWPGLELMFKHARRMCSAKFHGFDGMGRHKDFDLARCYRIMKASGYPGWVSLEYEGPEEPLPQLERMKGLAEGWLRDT